MICSRPWRVDLVHCLVESRFVARLQPDRHFHILSGATGSRSFARLTRAGTVPLEIGAAGVAVLVCAANVPPATNICTAKQIVPNRNAGTGCIDTFPFFSPVVKSPGNSGSQYS